MYLFACMSVNVCVLERRTEAPVASGVVFSFWLLRRELFLIFLCCCLGKNNTRSGARWEGRLQASGQKKVWHGKTEMLIADLNLDHCWYT